MAQPDQNFDAMRQDAIRRSREMQRRAVPSSAMSESPPKPDTHEHPPKQEPPNKLVSLPLSDDLNELLTNWDTEKLALAGLIWLLWKEGADPSLLLALAYILL